MEFLLVVTLFFYPASSTTHTVTREFGTLKACVRESMRLEKLYPDLEFTARCLLRA